MKHARNSSGSSDLMREAGQKRTTLASEFIALLKANKKFWLAPIIICVLLLGLLVLAGGTGAAPFIYTLF